MALQSETALAMHSLGVLGDNPADSLQPPLVDAVHLRWSFGSGRSFPWYGYYLFRRRHRETNEKECVNRYLPTKTSSTALPLANNFPTPSGNFSSDTPLLFSDDFEPHPVPELDLRQRGFLRFDLAQPAHCVTYKLGLRGRGDGGKLRCVTFDRREASISENPRTKDDVLFTVFDAKHEQSPASKVSSEASGYALNMDRRTRIQLPCPADRVEITARNGASTGTIRGFDGSGKEVVSIPFEETGPDPQVIVIEGAGIRQITLTAPQNEALLFSVCYRCEDDNAGTGTSDGAIEVQFFSGTAIIHQETIQAVAGAVVEGKFNSDRISAVRFSGGDAALIELCYQSVRNQVRGGWKPVEKCPQPLPLPVQDLDYPASGSLPTDLFASQNEALSRIRYGNPGDWGGVRFAAMHNALHRIVEQGPAGPAMKDVGNTNIAGTSADPAEQNPPNLSRLLPMNFLLLGSLHVPMAQMLGLYWADQTAQPNVSYDYLIIADHSNVGQNDPMIMLNWLSGPSLDFNDVDAWICLDRSLGTPSPLQAPDNLRAYALPGTTTDQADGSIRDMRNNTGLVWDLEEKSNGKLEPDAALMYVVRRADLKFEKPNSAVPAGDHLSITKTPHLVTDALSTANPPLDPPSHWPKLSFSFLDSGLTEGWYSYRINGIDLFGRYSPASKPARWHRWTPEPDPEPWYFDQAAGNGVVNPHGIALLDKIPPPSPTAVEAFALDPDNPDLIRDAAYNNWFATLSPSEQNSLTGLRVSWLWTFSHMRQAPDTKEFRVYYESGQPNLFKGRISAVNPSGVQHSTVATDMGNTVAAGAFAGCYLRSGGRSFPITSNGAASPLQLTAANTAPDHSIVPQAGTACSLTIPDGHPLYKTLGPSPNWQQRIWTVPFSQAVEGVMPAPVPGSDGDQLAGESATAAGDLVTLPPGVDLSDIRPMYFHIYLAEDTARVSGIYLVRALDIAARELTVDGSPSLTGGVSGWELGVLVRRYEIFLPAAGDSDRNGVNLPTSTQQPMVYAQVGVSAVDGKSHTDDDPGRAGQRWGDRNGNESSVAGPATIFRVHRTPPPRPQTAPDSDAVFASRADYQGKSYYTFRWLPLAQVDAHIFRAMDQTVYQRDWHIRQTRTQLSAGDHVRFFPAGWNHARRAAAAAALNAISSAGDYAALSADALDVLGRLPGNEGFRSKGNLNGRDWLVRRTRASLVSGDTDLFPADWADPLKRQNAAGQLNGIGAVADYAGLGNDANRVLAALPGNETAFSQLTHKPLSNQGPTTANRLGPDNPQGFPIPADLRAYIDSLDGRSGNTYFYRACFVDHAQNKGPLGLSSPPVFLPDVMPPRAPVFTRVLAGDPDPMQPGDRKICLRWASNREVDLAGYRIYRSSEAELSRDIRLMDQVHEMMVPPGDPALRANEVMWLDQSPAGLVTYHYRLVAVDHAGNQSAPSMVIAARAFDTALPEVPVLSLAWVLKAGKIRAEISWNSTHQVLVQRKQGGSNWLDLAKWREPGAVTVRDPFSDPGSDYQYRALVRKYTGALKRGEPELLEAQT